MILGCPRSGTRYAAALFEALGICCGHEVAFKAQKGIVDLVRWHKRHEGESSWLGGACLNLMPGPVVLLHQRRNPWQVIDSLAHRNTMVVADPNPKSDDQRDIHDIIAAYAPRVWTYERAVDRAAALLIDWNRACERMQDDPRCWHYETYRVEDVDRDLLRRLALLAGWQRTDEQLDRALAAIRTDANAGRKFGRSEVSDPLVARWIETHFQRPCPKAFTVEPATERHAPEELAEMMDPDLLAEVEDYANTWDYPAARAAVVT